MNLIDRWDNWEMRFQYLHADYRPAGPSSLVRFEKQSSQARNFKKICKHKAYGTRNFNQWNWKQLVLHGPNVHSILTHDIAILLGATCWTRFATLLVQQVATCCVFNTQQVASNNVSMWLKVNKGKSLLFMFKI